MDRKKKQIYLTMGIVIGVIYLGCVWVYLHYAIVQDETGFYGQEPWDAVFRDKNTAFCNISIPCYFTLIYISCNALRRRDCVFVYFKCKK